MEQSVGFDWKRSDKELFKFKSRIKMFKLLKDKQTNLQNYLAKLRILVKLIFFKKWSLNWIDPKPKNPKPKMSYQFYLKDDAKYFKIDNS